MKDVEIDDFYKEVRELAEQVKKEKREDSDAKGDKRKNRE